MDETQTQNLDSLIESLGLGYQALFVPQSQSRNKDSKDPCLNWTVQISRGTHKSQRLETDYMQGIGHIPKDAAKANGGARVFVEKYASEKGSYVKAWKDMIVAPYFSVRVSARLPAPKLKDVLYSLVSNSDVLNYDSFESWASELGYDIDSRQAEKTYQACLKIALKLSSIIGSDKLEQLREAFQDY